MKKIILLVALGFGGVNFLQAQCSAGEVELQIIVHTDTYGYEGYWELVPGTNACGTGTIVSGGNGAVGCNGGGNRVVSSGGYGNNQQITIPMQCVIQGNPFTIHYIDDWGDGGFEFEVRINGYIIENFKGGNAVESFSFIASEPVALDLAIEDIDKPYGYATLAPISIEAHFFNFGKDTISDLTFAYQVNNNAPVSTTLSGLSISNYSESHITHPTAWNPAANGVYQVKVWVDLLNGNPDMNNSNDTLIKQVEIGPGIPNIIDTYLTTAPVINQIGSNIDQLNRPTDLDFHPTLSRNELWVINKRTENAGGSTTIFFDAGTGTQTDVNKVDGNAWHFMSLPTGIAFSENENFANSPGVYDANHNGGQPFTGPALWSSDLAVYAQPSGGNGSHLDMLHESPECQGIAHEKDNVFWVFDGYNDDIVRYDFAADHGPGNDDHADGVIWRYSAFNVAKDPSNKVVSHLVYDKQTDWVYVVDYGNKRVFRIDATSGTKGNTPSFGPFETLAEYKHIINYTWETVVDSALVEPAGIDIIDNRLLVSDYATGEVIIYDISSMPATEMGRVATGAQGIMGIKIGPDGKIWYVDYDANTVNRIDQGSIGLQETKYSSVELYPNPTMGRFTLKGDDLKGEEIKVYSVSGQLLYNQLLEQNENVIDLNFLPAGAYTLSLNGSKSINKQLIIAR